MNVLNKLSIIAMTSIFLSSCGYSSYEECVKEEIKDNNGKMNQYIKSYCIKEHPPTTKQGKYYLKRSEYKIDWEKGIYVFKNYSDYNVDVLKIAMTRLECNKWKQLSSSEWDKLRNYLPGSKSIRPGETFSLQITDDKLRCSRAQAISYTIDY